MADAAARDAAGRAGTMRIAFVSVTVLFFVLGLVTALVDPLVAAVKGIFTLSDVMAQISASAYFAAYLFVSIPAALMIARRGFVASILIALTLMIAGCLVMLWAANAAVYAVVLAGLFVLASGITMLQVAINPLAAALGDPARSHFRLTLSQAFNSLGTFIGPLIGGALFLDGVEVKEGTVVTAAVRDAALAGIDRAYFWIAGLIALLFLFFLVARRPVAAAAPPPPPAASARGLVAEALASRWTRLGAGAIFLYVGSEVAIGTMLALFLNDDAIWGASEAARGFAPFGWFVAFDTTPGMSLQEAAKLVAFYWGGAMIGRLVGTALLARVAATRLLATATMAAAAMCLFVALVGGAAAGFVALAIGLFNSIMFPTVFTITLERSQASAEATSGLLCTAIVGGAALPPLVGLVAGSAGYPAAFAVPMACYALLAVFAIAAARTPVLRRGGDGRVAMH